jgi:hypothetical protein
MRKLLAATAVATAAIGSPGFAQDTAPPATDPIAIPADAPAGSSGPRGLAAGGAAAVVIVVLGLALLSSLAFFPE